jgi:hypothetical protein
MRGGHYPFAVFSLIQSFNLPDVRLYLRILQFMNSLHH